MRIGQKTLVCVILAIVCGGPAAPPARAADACRDFKWDVTKERALFALQATSVASGVDPKSAPSLVPNRLYQLQLKPQDQVNFAVAPGKNVPAGGGYAGIATIKISQPGSYRFALDAPLWIDVVSGGALLPAQDFQGQRDCDAPHKIVEFDLNGTPPFILQFSSSASETVRLTITPTPSRKL